jgi:hypothetical protein
METLHFTVCATDREALAAFIRQRVEAYLGPDTDPSKVDLTLSDADISVHSQENVIGQHVAWLAEVTAEIHSS